jgi:hypothetical protein
MIDKIEKVIYGVCGVTLLIVAFLYILTPVPDTDPREFIPDSVITAAPPKKLTTPKEGSKQAPLTANKITAEKNKVLGKLRKASTRPIQARDIKFKYMQIQKQSFNYIKNETNWLPELKLAGKQIRTSKKDSSQSLVLTRIKEGSLLRSVVGLEPGDSIELIDGERWDFKGENTLDFRSQAIEMIDRIEAGGSISLTITRNNSPQHLTFSLLE